jgi:hypothetical protein
MELFVPSVACITRTFCSLCFRAKQVQIATTKQPGMKRHSTHAEFLRVADIASEGISLILNLISSLDKRRGIDCRKNLRSIYSEIVRECCKSTGRFVGSSKRIVVDDVWCNEKHSGEVGSSFVESASVSTSHKDPFLFCTYIQSVQAQQYVRSLARTELLSVLASRSCQVIRAYFSGEGNLRGQSVFSA